MELADNPPGKKVSSLWDGEVGTGITHIFCLKNCEIKD